MDFPTQVSIQGDIELEVTVASRVIDEFNAREEDFINLRVGVDIPIFPNLYNLILLKDIAGEREPIFCQCMGCYDPDIENRSAGEIPAVYLTRNIQPIPDQLMEELIAADPRILEAAGPESTVIVDVTQQGVVH